MHDRQLTLTRHIAAPPQAVWRCWTDPAILPQWFGPDGFSCRTKEIALVEGGQWRFDMIAPDGTIFANRHRYTLMHAPQRIEFLMDDDTRDDPPMRVVVTLNADGAGTFISQTITLYAYMALIFQPFGRSSMLLLLLVLIKIIAEFIVFRMLKNSPRFITLLFLIIYPFWVFTVGLSVLFLKQEWKGRTIRH
jgi:uncharacterized protein YndB with AHSA1/START domain